MSSGAALITGGGSGIGRGIALALARRGVDVALVGRRAALLEQVAVEARAYQVRAVAIPGDLADAAQVATVFAASQATLGPIRILVNNAGSFAGGAISERTPEHISQTIALNLAAPMLLTQLALPELSAQAGAIVFVGSMASWLPLPYTTLYTASKMGLRGFASALRYELEPLGVRLLIAYPPTTATAMTEGMAQAAGVSSDSPFARMAAPEQVGEQIVAALVAGRHELDWPSFELLGAKLHHIAPWLVRAILASQRTRFAKLATIGEQRSRNQRRDTR